MLRAVALALLGAGLASSLRADPFSQGTLAVVQVGDGVAGLNNSAARTFLREVNTSGVLVQTLDVTSLAAPHRFVAAGQGTQDFSIGRTADGDAILFMGFDALPGTASIVATTVPRVVAFVDGNGEVTTNTALTDAFLMGSGRGVCSLDGINIWMTGLHGTGQAATAGLRHCTNGSSTSTLVAADPAILKTVGAFGGQLYCTAATGGRFGLCTVGTGLPTTTGQTINLLSDFPTSGASLNDFSFADANTVYIAEDNANTGQEGVQKWTKSGGVWTRAYTLNLGLDAGVRRIACSTQAGQTTIYALTAEATANRLAKVVDAGPLSAFSILGQAAASTAWRGIAWSPVSSNNKVVPTTYVVHQGFEISGSIGSFAQTDGDMLVLFNDEETLQCEVEVIGRASVQVPTNYRVVAAQFGGRPGLSVALKVFNYFLNRYEEVAGGPCESTLQVLLATITLNRSRYVGFNREVRMRVVWQPINDEDPSQDGWPLSTELANWFIS